MRFGDYETALLADVLPHEAAQVFSGRQPALHREWQYDEFCLVANYLVHPLKSVDLVQVGPGMDLGEYLKKRVSRNRERTTSPGQEQANP